MTEEPAPRVYPPPPVAWTTVGVLALTYMFSYMDRQILVLLIEPIKRDLNITDTQVSLLTGLAFASIYTVSGLFMGRAADNYVRKYVIIAGVGVWSVLTIMCGFARNFTQLFLARMGVGFGEAALTPTAYAMIADSFPPTRLSLGLSVFAMGGAMGAGMALIAGGLVVGWVDRVGEISLPIAGALASWQLVLVIVGAASLLMIVPLSFIPEPARQKSAERISADDDGGVVAFRAVLRYMAQHWRFYAPIIAGFAILNIVNYGVSAWNPTYFIRVVGWEASKTGVILGSLVIPPAIVGGLSGGWLSDRLFRQGCKSAPVMVLMIAAGVGFTLSALVIMAPAIWLKCVLLLCANFMLAFASGVMPAIIQLATNARIRAQVSAIYLLIINIAGIGFGPVLVALVTDFIFRDDMAVGASIMFICLAGAAVGVPLLYLGVNAFVERVRQLTDDVASGDAGAAGR